ncbi:MAG: hypothetical protein L6R39_000124 [Caloplaca ligustica]|nr:MAG: hypothetical protein L6R39_000124 [Caloplaca ligustica]
MPVSTSSPPTLLSLLAILLASTHTAHAKPYLRNLHLNPSNALEGRTCANPCGSESQYCCQASETCLTSGWPPIAQCVTGTGGSAVAPQQQAAQVQSYANGQYQLVTTTWTETDLVLRTSTYSTTISPSTPTTQAATVATAAAVCNTQLGESPCGGFCCVAGQTCNWNQMVCLASGGVTGDVSSFYYSSVTAGASGTAFVRPTSNTVQTVTSTGSATTTMPFASPSATQDGSTAGMAATTTNNGLTGGQIAGIVIGVLAGILLLLAICAFCCFKGLLDSILAFLGLGPKRRRTEETYIEERHSHHHSGGGGGGRTWYGAARPARIDRPKKDSGGLGGATAVAAGLGTLAVILGLKRRRDRKDKESYGTRSSYSYSDYTSASSASSDDRRTRGTGRYSRR